MPKPLPHELNYSDLLSHYRDTPHAQRYFAMLGIDDTGVAYPGGYGVREDEFASEVVRGEYQGYMDYTIYPNADSNQLLAQLQLHSTIKPTMDLRQSLNINLVASAGTIPSILPLMSHSHLGLTAPFARTSWLTQLDDKVKAHVSASQLSCNLGESILLIPGAISQSFLVTPKGPRLEHFTVSNATLKQYIEGEFTQDSADVTDSALFVEELQDKLLLGFAEDADYVIAQLKAVKNPPEPYGKLLTELQTLLEAVKGYSPESDGAMDFLNTHMPALEKILAQLPQGVMSFATARGDLEAFIKAIKADDSEKLPNLPNKKLLPYHLQNQLTNITHITLNRIDCLLPEAQRLHTELSAIVADDSTRPGWLKTRAQHILEKHQFVTEENYLGLLNDVDNDLRYLVGYFNYLDWAEKIVKTQLSQWLPKTLTTALQDKIKLAKDIAEPEAGLDSDTNKWLQPLNALQGIFTPLIDMGENNRAWTSLPEFAEFAMFDEEKKDLLKFDTNAADVTPNVVKQYLKDVYHLIAVFKLDKVYDNLKDFHNVLPETVVNEMIGRMDDVYDNFGESNLARLQRESDILLTDINLAHLQQNEITYNPLKIAFEDSKVLKPKNLATYFQMISLVKTLQMPQALGFDLAVVRQGVSLSELAEWRLDGYLKDSKAPKPIKDFITTNKEFFEAQIIKGMSKYAHFFKITAKELEQFGQLSNAELLAAADRLIEAKVAAIVKETGKSDLASKIQFRFYYNSLLHDALYHGCKHGFMSFETATLEQLPSLNDTHYYYDAFTSMLMVGAAFTAFTVSTGLFVASLYAPVIPPTVTLGQLILSTKMLCGATAALLGTAELWSGYSNARSLISTGFFSKSGVDLPDMLPSPEPVQDLLESNPAVNRKAPGSRKAARVPRGKHRPATGTHQRDAGKVLHHDDNSIEAQYVMPGSPGILTSV